MLDHKETLKFIGKNIQFGKSTADFLHASMVNMNKKIADQKQRQKQEQKEPALKLMKDVWMGIAPDDQMNRVGVAQSAVCNTDIPFLFHSGQQHQSNEQANGRKNYQTLTLLQPTPKAQFDMFLKAENPIGNPQEQQLQLERLEFHSRNKA
ncbi:hypothetical protein scyTo_0021798 [Scyliorhinus torazame]|uniref:Uncharacterized protein n=1 Tax=Scyliorhinus torazame TaxID=75743 RepID=A0A401Q752_SCYTO|nr:hypothetical protein [Scyliorhinus torazame]